MLSETATLPVASDWAEGPRALVTGAASGIGEACARLLVERGYSVVGMDVRRGLIDIEWCLGSVVEPKHCMAAVELAAPDVMIHCAGVGAGTLGLKHSHEMTDQWQAVIDVNLTGSWNMAKAYLSVMGSGSMLFVSSISGLVNAGRGARNVNYAASKAGVIGMARALAVEYAPSVRVNVLCPGAVDTPMYRRGVQAAPDMMARFIEEHPLGRPLTVREVADMAVAVVENSGMTGSVVTIDGGYTAA